MSNANSNDFLGELFKQLQGNDSVLKVRLNDERLEKLAEYDITKGYTKTTATPEQLREKFTEYKTLVKRGEFTLKGLEDDIYTKWGVVENSREQFSPADDIIISGFNMADVEVADIKDDSPENH